MARVRRVLENVPLFFAIYGTLSRALAIAVGPGSENTFSVRCLHRQTTTNIKPLN
jgi:hypothetical protein